MANDVNQKIKHCRNAIKWLNLTAEELYDINNA